MLRTIVLLTVSNIFMTFAWYAHLRDLRAKPLWIAIAVSWGIAFFEYCVQVPANRIGAETMSVAQLKILQEMVTMCVFAVFATFYLRERLTWNYAAAAVCMMGAAFFMFRK
ncbi:membrane protein [Deltaproteobacteria bacterium]|nr:membrane protein [Deltaproteobacteria bacterium]